MARSWAAIATLLWFSAPAAAAESASDEALAFQIAQLNKTAIYQIEEKQFDVARKRLLEAERLAKARGGEVGDALLPRTYVNLGALEILAGAPGRSSVYFWRALCRHPGIRPSGRVIARPVVEKLFDTVRNGYRDPPRCRFRPDTLGRDPDLPVKVAALDCPNLDEAFVGTPFVVRCAAAPRLSVERVTLSYSSVSSDEYTLVEMRRSPHGWWIGAVPAKVVQGKSFRYYFEGWNSAGHIIVTNGSTESPNFALVMEPEVCGCDAY